MVTKDACQHPASYELTFYRPQRAIGIAHSKKRHPGVARELNAHEPDFGIRLLRRGDNGRHDLRQVDASALDEQWLAQSLIDCRTTAFRRRA
jgi:hypothetical protein